VKQDVAGVQYWITFVGKSHSAVFHTEECFGEHAPPQTFMDMLTDPVLDPAGETWWSWLEPPGSDQYYPVEFTYIPPGMMLPAGAGVPRHATPPGLTWTNYDFSLGVKNCTAPRDPPRSAGLPTTWTQIVVRLKHSREPIVLKKKDKAVFVVPGAAAVVPAGATVAPLVGYPPGVLSTRWLQGLIVVNHSEWTPRLADVAYVYDEAVSPPPVASDSGLPTTPLAILVDVTTNVTIAAFAWAAWGVIDDAVTAKGICLITAATVAVSWLIGRIILLTVTRCCYALSCCSLAVGGAWLFGLGLFCTVTVTALAATSLGLQNALDANSGVILTSILLGISTLNTLYTVVQCCTHFQKLEVRFPLPINSDDDEPETTVTIHRTGFSANTEIFLGIFSFVAFALCVASLALFFVSLERQELTIPAFTNITAAARDDVKFTGGDIIDNGAALQIGLYFLFGAITTLTHSVVAFIAAADASSNATHANWRSNMLDAVLKMNDTIGSATAAVVFNLPLVMTNLITVVAKRRLLDTRRTYPIIAALWAVMLVALVFHYISTKAYDNRVSTATAAQIRIRVQRCLRILKKHVRTHSLKIDSQRADSQNLIRAYNDVRFLTDELRMYCSPADVEGFRAKTGPLKKALQDYAVSIGALQQTASVGGTAATDALITACRATHMQAVVAQQAFAAAEAVNAGTATLPTLVGALQHLIMNSIVVTTLLTTANAAATAVTVDAAQQALVAAVNNLQGAGPQATGIAFNPATAMAAAQTAVDRAIAVRDAAMDRIGYVKPDLLKASVWSSHALLYVDELIAELPQVKKDGTTSSSAGVTV
jgi:hypothetical protein